MSAITVTVADRGATVTLQCGQHLIVQLAENPTTGFRWALVQGDGAIILLKDSIYTPTRGTTIGRGGQHNFFFEAGKPGTTSLKFKLWRAWEGESSTRQLFDMMLRVRP